MASSIRALTLTLNDTQIRNLNATPVTCIRAPGAGKGIFVWYATFAWSGGVAYTLPGTPVSLSLATPAQRAASEASGYYTRPIAGLLDSADPLLAFGVFDGFVGYDNSALNAPADAIDPALLHNQPLQIAYDGDAGGECTDGDAANTLSVHIYYSIIPVPTPPPPFSPAAIANVLWLDAIDLGLTNGAAVPEWDAASGSVASLAQPTSGNQPTYHTSGIPAGAFVAISDTPDSQWLTAALGSAVLPPGDFYIHLTLSVIDFFSYNSVLLIGGDTAESPSTAFTLYIHNQMLSFELIDGADYDFDTTLSTTTWYQIEIMYQSGVFSAAIGGIDESTTHTLAFTPPSSDTVITLGNDRPLYSDDGNVNIASLVIHSGSITSDQRAAMRSYITERYGV